MLSRGASTPELQKVTASLRRLPGGRRWRPLEVGLLQVDDLWLSTSSHTSFRVFRDHVCEADSATETVELTQKARCT